MRFQHSDPGPKRVIEAVTPCFNPEQDPKDREIEKENDVRHLAAGKCDSDNGRGAGNSPVRGYVETLSPDHDPSHFAAIEMGHRIDVARIINAVLDRNGCLLGCGRSAIFGCHDYLVNWITEAESNIIMAIVLAHLIDPRQIVLNLRAQTQADAMVELVELLFANGRIKNVNQFLRE